MNDGGHSDSTKTTPPTSDYCNSMVGNTSGSSTGGGSGRVHFRSQSGCCICGTKSSSSRFVVSQRYAEHFTGCFGAMATGRNGDLCNACVLCVKRWLKATKQPGWFAKVLDSKKGPGPKHMKEITKRARRREARQAAEFHTGATVPTSSPPGGKSRQATAVVITGTVLRRSSPGYSTTKANFSASPTATRTAAVAVVAREHSVRHRQQITGQPKMWPEPTYWHGTDSATSARVNSSDESDRMCVAANCPLTYSSSAGVRCWNNGDTHLHLSAHLTSTRDQLVSAGGAEKIKGLRMTSTRAATTRRLGAKSAAATTCRALSSSTPNHGNRDNVNLQPPAHVGTSSSFSTCNSETSDYGSASSLSASSSTSSAFSASLPLSQRKTVARCCCYTHHRSASISRTQHNISRGSVVASTGLAMPPCKCCQSAASRAVASQSRDDGEATYKRPRCDSGNGSTGRDKQSTATTRLTSNNFPSATPPTHTGVPNCTAYVNNGGYPTRHGAAVTFRKSCCCRCSVDAVSTNGGAKLSEFRLPPPPMTSSAGGNHGRRSSLACETTSGSTLTLGPAGATNHATNVQSLQKKHCLPVVAVLNTGDALESGVQSTRRYNRRVVLPPVRMTDNPELDALYREIMDLNSQAVNFDSREIHMAVQHKLRQRNRITANSTTSGGGSLSGQATTSSSVSSADGSFNLDQHSRQTAAGCTNGGTIQTGGQVTSRLESMPAPSRLVAKRHHQHRL